MYWAEDKKYYFGLVAAHTTESKVHVNYDDGDTEFLNLSEEIWDRITENDENAVESRLMATSGVIERYREQNEHCEPVFDLASVFDRRIQFNNSRNQTFNVETLSQL